MTHCQYCGQRNDEHERCCWACGAPLPLPEPDYNSNWFERAARWAGWGESEPVQHAWIYTTSGDTSGPLIGYRSPGVVVTLAPGETLEMFAMRGSTNGY